MAEKIIQEKKERPLGELFMELKNEVRTLIKQEMTLVRLEVSQKMSRAGKDAAALGIGGVLLYAGLLTLIGAIVLGIGAFIPLWLSALLVSIVFIIIGALMVMKGIKDLKQMSVTPERSTETIKETAKWAKSEVK